MKRYRAKTLFTGYKIGLKTPDVYIGVPEKYFVDLKVEAVYGNESRIFDLTKSVASNTFPDKFNPSQDYRLHYFLWQKRGGETNAEKDN